MVACAIWLSVRSEVGVGAKAVREESSIEMVAVRRVCTLVNEILYNEECRRTT
jgi:hypothetical protein